MERQDENPLPRQIEIREIPVGDAAWVLAEFAGAVPATAVFYGPDGEKYPMDVFSREILSDARAAITIAKTTGGSPVEAFIDLSTKRQGAEQGEDEPDPEEPEEQLDVPEAADEEEPLS